MGEGLFLALMSSSAPQNEISSSPHKNIEDAIRGVLGVSRFSLLDEQRFRRFFQQSEKRYASSWLYALRASHMPDGALGYAYVWEGALATIGYRHGYVYVFPVFDATGGAALQSLCVQIASATDKSIIIKKYDKELYPQTTVSTAEALPLEDDTCPETYIDLRKYFQPSGRINPVLHKLQRRARSFERSSSTIRAVQDIRQIPLQKLETFLAHDKEKYLNYIQILRYLYNHTDTEARYLTTVFTDDTKVRGLYMAERLPAASIGLYGAITSKDEGGITEWMDLTYFRYVYDQKIDFILLGGAENTGIAAYISRLIPYRPIYSVKSVQFKDRSSLKSGVGIRLATEQDIRQIAKLYLEVYNNLDELRETWTKVSARKFISHFYRRQPDLFFIAEKQGKIIGAIVAAVQPWWDGNHLVEGELIVEPNILDRSVVNRLMKQLLVKANEIYDVVSWDTIVPNVDKHPLAEYKQFGFEKVQQWDAISGDVAKIINHIP